VPEDVSAVALAKEEALAKAGCGGWIYTPISIALQLGTPKTEKDPLFGKQAFLNWLRGLDLYPNLHCIAIGDP